MKKDLKTYLIKFVLANMVMFYPNPFFEHKYTSCSVYIPALRSHTRLIVPKVFMGQTVPFTVPVIQENVS